jgi:hypothetical protein
VVESVQHALLSFIAGSKCYPTLNYKTAGTRTQVFVQFIGCEVTNQLKQDWMLLSDAIRYNQHMVPTFC